MSDDIPRRLDERAAEFEQYSNRICRGRPLFAALSRAEAAIREAAREARMPGAAEIVKTIRPVG